MLRGIRRAIRRTPNNNNNNGEPEQETTKKHHASNHKKKKKNPKTKKMRRTKNQPVLEPTERSEEPHPVVVPSIGDIPTASTTSDMEEDPVHLIPTPAPPFPERTAAPPPTTTQQSPRSTPPPAPVSTHVSPPPVPRSSIRSPVEEPPRSVASPVSQDDNSLQYSYPSHHMGSAASLPYAVAVSPATTTAVPSTSTGAGVAPSPILQPPQQVIASHHKQQPPPKSHHWLPQPLPAPLSQAALAAAVAPDAARRYSICSYTDSEDGGVTMDPSILSSASSLTADDFTLATLPPGGDPIVDEPQAYVSLLGLALSSDDDDEGHNLATHPIDKLVVYCDPQTAAAHDDDDAEDEERWSWTSSGNPRRATLYQPSRTTPTSVSSSSLSQVHRLKSKSLLHTTTKKDWDAVSTLASTSLAPTPTSQAEPVDKNDDTNAPEQPVEHGIDTAKQPVENGKDAAEITPTDAVDAPLPMWALLPSCTNGDDDDDNVAPKTNAQEVKLDDRNVTSRGIRGAKETMEGKAKEPPKPSAKSTSHPKASRSVDAPSEEGKLQGTKRKPRKGISTIFRGLRRTKCSPTNVQDVEEEEARKSHEAAVARKSHEAASVEPAPAEQQQQRVGVLKRRRKRSQMSASVTSALQSAAEADARGETKVEPPSQRRVEPTKPERKVEDPRTVALSHQQQLQVRSSPDKNSSVSSSSSSTTTFRIVGVVDPPSHNTTTTKPKETRVSVHPMSIRTTLTDKDLDTSALSSSALVVRSPQKKTRRRRSSRYSTPAIEQARLKKEAATSRASQVKSRSTTSSSLYQQPPGENVTWFVCVETDDPVTADPFVMLPVRSKDEDASLTDPEDLILLQDEDDDDETPEAAADSGCSTLVPFCSFMPHVQQTSFAWKPSTTGSTATKMLFGLECTDGTRLRAKLFSTDRLERLVQKDGASRALVVHASLGGKEGGALVPVESSHEVPELISSDDDEGPRKPPTLGRTATDPSELALILQENGDDEEREPPSDSSRNPPTTLVRSTTHSRVMSKKPSAVLYHPKPYRSTTVVGHAMEALQELEQRKTHLRVRLRKTCPTDSSSSKLNTTV